MLNKRTNLLLKKRDFHLLTLLAEKENLSVGELVRRAIKNEYEGKLKAVKRTINRRKIVIEEILSLRKKQKLAGKINYKLLIEEGRKY